MRAYLSLFCVVSIVCKCALKSLKYSKDERKRRRLDEVAKRIRDGDRYGAVGKDEQRPDDGSVERRFENLKKKETQELLLLLRSRSSVVCRLSEQRAFDEDAGGVREKEVEPATIGKRDVVETRADEKG